jgi:DNA-binding transcriptional LysR family regulator
VRPLELELLRTFVAVVDRQSFALAAEQVHRTQSAVTQQMARLEEQLGVALFQKVSLVGLPEGTVDSAHPSVRLRTSPLVWMAAADYVHDPSQAVPLVLPDEPSSYRATALAALEAHRIPWRIRHVSASLAFGGVRAALRAGLGVTVRVIEMLTADLRVLGETEGLPRLPNMCIDLYLRDKRVSGPARRLFESVGEGGVRQPIRIQRARAIVD